MTVELPVVIDEYRTWYAASDAWSTRIGAVIIPIDQFTAMSDTEIASAVRKVAAYTEVAVAENTAQNLLSYGATVASLRQYPEAELIQAELDMMRHIDKSETIRRAYDLIIQFHETHTQARKPRPKARKEVAARYEKILVALGRRDGFACTNCRAVEDLQIDHILPVSRGGTSDLVNLQILCKPCNKRKGNKLPGEYVP
jgi:hypothetical protein